MSSDMALDFLFWLLVIAGVYTTNYIQIHGDDCDKFKFLRSRNEKYDLKKNAIKSWLYVLQYLQCSYQLF